MPLKLGGGRGGGCGETLVEVVDSSEDEMFDMTEPVGEIEDDPAEDTDLGIGEST